MTFDISKMVGQIRFVDTRTLSRNSHSPKDRTGAAASADVAVGEGGLLRSGYERILGADGTITGYALRADAAVYKAAEDTLRNALRGADAAICAVCVKVGGGSYVLPEVNEGLWAEVVAQIKALVEATNATLDAMTVDAGEGSPKINELLLNQGRKPIRMRFQPLLHSPLRLADPNAEAQAREFVASTWQTAKDIIDAVRSADPETIGNVIREAGAIEAAIMDPTTRKSLSQVLAASKAAKEAAETARRAQRSIDRAAARTNRSPAETARDARQIETWTQTVTQAAMEREIALATLADAEKTMDAAFGRFAQVEIDGDRPTILEEVRQDNGRFVEVETAAEVILSTEAQIAAAASEALAAEHAGARYAMLDIDITDGAGAAA